MTQRSSPKNGKSPRARPSARKQSRKSKPVQSTTATTKRSQKTPHGEASSDGIEKTERLFSAQQAIRKDIRRLTEQAEGGDPDALAILLNTAILSVCGLHGLQVSNPDALKPSLAEAPRWPCLISNNDVYNTTLIARLRKLGFGSKASTGDAAVYYFARTPTLASLIASELCVLLEGGRKEAVLRQETNAALEQANDLMNAALELANSIELASGKPIKDGLEKSTSELYRGSKRIKDGLEKWMLEVDRSAKLAWEETFKSWGKPQNDEYLKSMIEDCSKLPPLSEASWKAWFAVARQVFMYLTNGRPEEIQTLQAIGGLIFDPIDKKLKFQGQEYRPSKERGKVRDRIVTSIRYAFKIKAVESGLKP